MPQSIVWPGESGTIVRSRREGVCWQSDWSSLAEGGKTPMSDPHITANITIGTPVIAYNGDHLGEVRDVHPHFILVHQEGEHGDFEVPVHAITSFEDGKLHVSVNRWSVNAVDDEETFHQHDEESAK